MLTHTHFRMPALLASAAALVLTLVAVQAAPAWADDSAVTFAMVATDQSNPPVVVSDVDSGAQVTYRLSVQCSGTVPCSGATIDLTSALVAAGTVTYASWTPPTGVGTTLTPTVGGVSIQFTSPLPVGFSQTFPVTFQTKNWTTVDQTVLDMSGVVSGTNFVAPPAVQRNVTINATHMSYSLDKHTVSTQPAYAGGPNYSYDIWLVGDPALQAGCGQYNAQTPSGWMRLASFTLSDELPPGAVFVSASTYEYGNGGVGPTATYDPGTNTVSSTWTGTEAALCGTIAGGVYPAGMRVTVNWPLSYLNPGDTPLTITNEATVSGLYVDGETLDLSDTAVHELKPFEASGDGYFNKVLRGYNDYQTIYMPEGMGFRISYGNVETSTVNVTQSVINDSALPDEIATIYFDVDSVGTMTWTASDSSTGVHTLPTTFSSSVLPPGTTLHSIQVVDTAPITPGSTRVIHLIGAPTTDSDVGGPYENCATASLTFAAGVGTQDLGPQCAHFTIAAGIPHVWSGYLLTHDALPGNVSAEQVVQFHAGIRGDGITPLHPQLTLCVPSGWTIDVGSIVAADGASAGFTVGAPVAASGETCVTLTWPSGVELVGGAERRVDFQASPDASAAAGTNRPHIYGGDSTIPLIAESIVGGAGPWGTQDLTDVDGDGNTTEYLSRWADLIEVGSNSNLTVLKSVQDPDGVFVSPPSATPVVLPVGTTETTYRLMATNAGNTAATGLVAYDVLPFVGDTGTSGSVAGTSRGSEFGVIVSSPITAPAGVVVEYSASSNPCRPDVNATTPGCVNDWGTSLPAGGARAIRASYTGTAAPGAGFTLDFVADVTAGAPGQVACNSMAAVTDQTLATEPAPVCIHLQPVGSLVIVKTLAGSGVAAFGQGPFVFDVVCTFDGGTVYDDSITLEPLAGETVITSSEITSLPIGTSCTVTETENGGADSTPAPVTVLIDDELEPIAADLTNRFSAGTVSLTKTLEGAGATTLAATAATYIVTVTCQVEVGAARTTLYSDSIEIRGGEEILLTDAVGDPVLLPLGARCFGEETDPGFATRWTTDYDSFENAAVVTESAADALQPLVITATNRFDVVEIRVSKTVAGAGAAGPYDFGLECTVDGVPYPLAASDALFELSHGQSRTIAVAPGADCSVREIDAPVDAVVSYLDSDDTTAGGDSDGDVSDIETRADVAVTNTYAAAPPASPVPLAFTGLTLSMGPALLGISLLVTGIASLVLVRRRRAQG